VTPSDEAENLQLYRVILLFSPKIVVHDDAYRRTLRE